MVEAGRAQSQQWGKSSVMEEHLEEIQCPWPLRNGGRGGIGDAGMCQTG